MLIDDLNKYEEQYKLLQDTENDEERKLKLDTLTVIVNKIKTEIGKPFYGKVDDSLTLKKFVSIYSKEDYDFKVSDINDVKKLFKELEQKDNNLYLGKTIMFVDKEETSFKDLSTKIYSEKKKDNVNEFDVFVGNLIKVMEEKSDSSFDEVNQMISKHYQNVAILNKYSNRNISALSKQCDERNMTINEVKSYKEWKTLGAQVEKGESSLSVFAPKTTYKIKRDENNQPIKKGRFWDYELDEDGKKISNGVTFIKVPVFNSSQTNAEELGIIKKLELRTSDGDISDELYNSFKNELSTQFKIDIFEHELGVSKGGYYSPSTHQIVLNTLRGNEEKLKVLFHEIGHSLLHNKESMNTSEDISIGIKEAEAESVSYILSSKLGIQGGSDFYIKTWGNDVKVVKDRLERITQASKDVFNKVDFDKLIQQEQERVSSLIKEEVTTQSEDVNLSEYETKSFDSVDEMIEQFKSDNEDITIDTVHSEEDEVFDFSSSRDNLPTLSTDSDKEDTKSSKSNKNKR